MSQEHSGFTAINKPILLGTGAIVKQDHRLPMENFRRGVAAPTATIRNNIAGYLFAADAEELFIQFCVPYYWDEASDIILVIYCVLNADEAANDLIDWETIVISVADHEDADVAPVQNPGAAHNIVNDNAAGTLHKVNITLDWDSGVCPIAKGDNVTVRLSRTANVGQAGYVAGVIVLDICIEYQSNKLGEVV